MEGTREHSYFIKVDKYTGNLKVAEDIVHSLLEGDRRIEKALQHGKGFKEFLLEINAHFSWSLGNKLTCYYPVNSFIAKKYLELARTRRQSSILGRG